jgi:Mce-associated membrane protein
VSPVRLRWRTALWWGATVSGLLACALAGWWWAARPPADAGPAHARAAALADGRADLTALSSADGASSSGSDRSLQAWLNATTGSLHDGLKSGSGSSLASLRSSGTDARGSVTAAALTALDPQHGRATLLATLSVQVSAVGTTEQTQQRGIQAQLVRTGSGWKVSALTTLSGGAS